MSDNQPDRNTPLRLADAAKIAFPNGGITAASLRREAAKGRLAIERIAGKDFVTLAAIDEMRALCRIQPTDIAQSWQSGRQMAPEISEQERGKAARAALLATAEKLKASLRKDTETKKAQAAARVRLAKKSR